MSRLDYLTIAIVGLCIVALIYLVYRYVNLPHPTQNPNAGIEQIDPDSSKFTKKQTAGYPSEDSTAPLPSTTNPQKTVPAKTQEKQVVAPEPVSPQPAPVVTETVIKAPSTLTSGRYMVIGGSFEQTSRAQVELKKIQRLGYSDASIEKFNRGTYASILVNRFESKSDAQALVKALKSKGIDAMVLEKK